MMSANVVLLGFLLFCRHFSCFWGLGTQIHFSTPKMVVVTLQKHYVSKGKCPIFKQEILYKRKNGSMFTHVREGGYGIVVVSRGALDHYTLNLDISKRYFSARSAV